VYTKIGGAGGAPGAVHDGSLTLTRMGGLPDRYRGRSYPNPHIDFPQFCVWLQIPKSARLEIEGLLNVCSH